MNMCSHISLQDDLFAPTQEYLLQQLEALRFVCVIVRCVYTHIMML